jgi:hypothetical protein
MTLRPPTLSKSCIILLSRAASCQLCITPIHATITALSQILTQAMLQAFHTTHKPQSARGHLPLQKSIRTLRSCRRLTYLGGVICTMQVNPWITQTSRDSCSHPGLNPGNHPSRMPLARVFCRPCFSIEWVTPDKPT